MSKKLKWLVGILLLVAVLGVVPSYRFFRQWRATTLIGASLEALEASPSTAALEELDNQANAGFLLAATNPGVIRRYAEFLSARGDARALQVWQSLMNSGEATPKDRFRAVETALAFGYLESARALLQEILTKDSTDVRARLLTARIEAGRGNLEAAEALLRMGGAPEPQLQTALSEVLILRKTPSSLAEAKSHLELLANSGSAQATQALILLLRPEFPESTRREAMGRLEKRGGLHADEQLALLAVQLQLNPEDQARFIQITNEQLKPDPKAYLAFLRWLNQGRLHQFVLTSVSWEEAFSRQDYFLCAVDALAAQGGWEELARIFEDRRVPMTGQEASVFKARIASELDRSEAPALWERAFIESRESPKSLLYLAQYSEACGKLELARKAFRQLADDPRTGQIGGREWVRFEERHGATAEVRDAVSKIVESMPGSLEAQNDEAYLNLLLNENADAAYATAVKLVSKEPTFLAYRATLGLALFRQGANERAAVEFADLPVDWLQVQPGWAAVCVAIRAANGKEKEAAELARKIDLTRLKPEERALIERN